MCSLYLFSCTRFYPYNLNCAFSAIPEQLSQYSCPAPKGIRLNSEIVCTWISYCSRKQEEGWVIWATPVPEYFCLARVLRSRAKALPTFLTGKSDDTQKLLFPPSCYLGYRSALQVGSVAADTSNSPAQEFM